MKKYMYIMMGAAVLAFTSACNKEEDINEPVIENQEQEEEEDVKPFVLNPNIPETLTVSFGDTKTSYDENGKFSWSVGDEVDLIYVQKDSDEKVIAEGWVAYVIANEAALSNSNRMATFTIKDGQEGKTDAESGALKDFENTHLASYGRGASNASVARPYLSIGNTINIPEFGAPIISLQQNLTGASSEVILLGAESDGQFVFQTAAAVLNVTVTGIPAEAKELRLCTSDKSISPIDGDFIIDDTREIQKGDYRKYGTGNVNNSCHDYVAAAVSGASSQSFYFNVPTGEYAANTISIVLVDTDNNELLKKTITADFTFNRNDLIEVEFANEWTTLGTGKFIDNFLWAKIVAKGLDKDIPDYVNVTIQQNVSDPKTFRLVDPYGAAASQFGYSSANAANRDKYLVFTVDATTTGSSVTGITTHRTGFVIDGSNYNPEIVYPTTYSAESSTAQNKVVVGNASLPVIVQFAPAYHYSGYPMTSSYTYSQAFDKKGVFRIVFPGATGYEGTLTPAASATAATLSPLAWTHEANAGRIRMVISQYTDYELAAPQVNSYYCGNYPSGNDADNAVSNSSWNASAKVTAASLSSGPAYLSWFTSEADTENNIYSQGRLKVYYISSADVSSYCKKHTSAGYKGTAQSEALSGSYTFAVSEDPTVGNIKMTEFDGLCYDVSEMSEPGDTHQLYSSLYWIAPRTTVYTGADPVFADGYAQYGVLSGSSIVLDASQPFFHRGSVNVYVYSYTDYAGSGRGAANTPERFKFTISEGKVNVGETYVNARFDGNNQASAPYANTITEVIE